MKLLPRVDGIESARRSRVERLDFDGRIPSAKDVARLTLGPTGNLRAPTVIAGRKMLVGFSEDLYGVLG